MLLGGQTAIITGASRGIGRAIALAFAEQGASLVINGTRQDLLCEVAEEVEKRGQRCLVVAGDISDPAISRSLVLAAVENFKRVEILVNNAGIIKRAPTEQMPLEDWHRVLDINLSGTLYGCLAVLPYMKAQRYGKIVNMSSSAGKTPHRNASPSYGASKAGILSLTRHLALEMAPYGIYVNAVCPGPIETDLSREWTEDYRKQLLSRIPLGRIGSPEEVAQAVLFLSSRMSDFITGESININGGMFMD